MTQHDKFKAVLQRALQNGYKYHGLYNGLVDFLPVIFSKDFAKAYWGEDPIIDWNANESDDNGNGAELQDTCIDYWEYQLTVLVLQDNYIDYLYSFIDHTTTDKGDK